MRPAAIPGIFLASPERGAACQGYSGVGMRICPALSSTALSDGEFVSGVAKCLMRECERRKARLTRHLADLRNWLQFLAYRVHCSREDLVYGAALFQRLDARAFKFATAKRLKGYTTAAMATAATVLQEGVPIVSNWSVLIGDQFDLREVQNEFLERIHWMTNVSAPDFERVGQEIAELCGVPSVSSRPREPSSATDGAETTESSSLTRVQGSMSRSHSSALFLLNAEAAPRFGVQADPGLDGSFSDRETSGDWEYH